VSIIDKIKASAKNVVKETSEILLNISNHVIKNSNKYAALGLFGLASYLGINASILSGSDSIILLLTLVGLFASGSIELEDFTNEKEDEDAIFFVAIASITTLFVSDASTADAILGILPDVEMLQHISSYFLLNAKDTMNDIEAVSRLLLIKIKNSPEQIIEIMKEYTDNNSFNKNNEVISSLDNIIKSGLLSNQPQPLRIKANNGISI
jgi:hypothetical protein